LPVKSALAVLKTKSAQNQREKMRFQAFFMPQNASFY